MQNISSRLLWLITIFIIGTTQIFAQANFQAGSSRKEITPTEAVPMWGYGDRHDKLSDGKIDPLYAAAVVIKAGDTKLAIVGLDLGRSPNEKSLQIIRQRVKTATGIENSFIAGSHTHHAPVLELTDEVGKGKGKFDASIRYYKFLEEQIITAIVEANFRLQPAKLASGIFPLEGFNRNRHTKLEPKPVDKDLGLLRFEDLSGKPIAVVVNFTAHPTNIPSSTLKFSADFVGAMKAEIEKQTGANAIFMQGASGDMSANKTNGQDYQSFGQSLAKEALKFMTTLTAKEISTPSLQDRGIIGEKRHGRLGGRWTHRQWAHLRG